MAVQKQPIGINFGQGLDLKNDPWQIATGSFLALTNSVFTTGNMLKKRNGNKQLAPLIAPANLLTTFKNDAIAIGNNEIQMLSNTANVWLNKGPFTEASISAVPIVRTSTSQVTSDVAVLNDLACTGWTDSDGLSYYQIVDAASGHITIPITPLPAGSSQVRVFSLGTFFFITYFVLSLSSLEYIVVPSLPPESPHAPLTINSQIDVNHPCYDGYVA